jgi:hypothetical protein
MVGGHRTIILSAKLRLSFTWCVGRVYDQPNVTEMNGRQVATRACATSISQSHR